MALSQAVLEVADNQIREYAPVTATYERLISEGIHPEDARRFIANLVTRQMFYAMKGEQPFEELDSLFQLSVEQLDQLDEVSLGGFLTVGRCVCHGVPMWRV